MKNATTDSTLAIASDEFVWCGGGLTEAHAYILPVVVDMLGSSAVEQVLDVGCGNGALTGALAERGFEVTGIDSSETGLEIAQQSCPNARFQYASIDEPLPPELHGRFDAVIASEVIEHLFLPRHLFQRAAEALRPAGILVVSTPYHGYLKNLALAFAGKFDEHWHPLRDHGHIKFFSERTLAQAFTEQGFSVERAKRVGRIPALAKSIVMEGRIA